MERRAGDRLRESYRWANTGDSPLRITSLAVSTPWRDVYAADGVAQETAVHAHLSATGAQAWALAKPMHGQGPFFGLTVREGAVRAYSVEARNQFTGSNVRGHLLLHVTDHARHPQAFGGQPALTLAPGASYRLVWELAWFEDEAAFLAVADQGWPDWSDGAERTAMPVLLAAAEQALGWLLAFAGPQRHVRLRHVAIRHWDGYWFGLRRQWGDTFPHYWSALTAVALLELPDELRSERGNRMAEAILRANLAAYDEHARGCCAFLYPSCVDGVPAHGPDPLDNDQDWALVYALRSGLVP